MTGDLELLWQCLRFESGVLAGILAWMGVLRFAFSMVSARLKEFMENALPSEQKTIQRILSSRTWRIICFVVSVLSTIRLPERAGKLPLDKTAA